MDKKQTRYFSSPNIEEVDRWLIEVMNDFKNVEILYFVHRSNAHHILVEVS